MNSPFPRPTLVDPAALDDWNRTQERTREAYAEEPFAAVKLGLGRCSRCREGKHHRCSTEARGTAGLLRACLCWISDHDM